MILWNKTSPNINPPAEVVTVSISSLYPPRPSYIPSPSNGSKCRGTNFKHAFNIKQFLKFCSHNSKQKIITALQYYAGVIYKYQHKSYMARRKKNFHLKTAKFCIACGARASVVHHVIQIQHGGLNNSRNAVSLCNTCHCLIHEWLVPHTPKYITEMDKAYKETIRG